MTSFFWDQLRQLSLLWIDSFLSDPGQWCFLFFSNFSSRINIGLILLESTYLIHFMELCWFRLARNYNISVLFYKPLQILYYCTAVINCPAGVVSAWCTCPRSVTNMLKHPFGCVGYKTWAGTSCTDNSSYLWAIFNNNNN